MTRQPALLGLSRASVYYEPRPVAERDLALMRRLDELHLELPFAGSRRLRDLLRAEGTDVGREHVRTLMRRIGITAIYRRPKTTRRPPDAPGLSKPAAHAQHHAAESRVGGRYPYVAMARGCVYLVVIMEWVTRKVLT